jgi:4-amino-4-deoxy-L-arabinose transferase-like glycosyltransferase
MIFAPRIDDAKGSPEAAWSKSLLLIVILAFALRAAVRLHSGEADFWANSYGFFFELARSIADGKGIAVGGVATIFRVPLYPIALAALTFGHREFLPIVLFQSLIGAGTVLCAGLIAREMFGNAAAVIAAGITAIYPYYVVHDTALQETSLYTFLTALAVLLLIRTRRNGSYLMAALAGLVLGAAVLTRANLGPFAALAPLWLIIGTGSIAVPWQRRLWTCLLCAGAIALTVSPWLARSYWITHSPTLGSETGFFLWLGNNPYTFSHYPNGSIDRSQDVAVAALTPHDKAELKALGANEAAVDNWFLKKGVDYMLENPWLTIASGFRKIGAAFCLLPSPRHNFWPNLVYFFSYAPVMILGLWGMWAGRRNWREHLIFYALFASFIGVTAIFFGHTSYRAYLDVYWIVFAAGFLAQVWSKILSKRRSAPAHSDNAPQISHPALAVS